VWRCWVCWARAGGVCAGRGCPACVLVLLRVRPALLCSALC
jgi:hypothetical protein